MAASAIARTAGSIACLCLLALSPSLAAAQQAATSFDPYAGAAPIAVMVEVEPDLLVAGSDMPRIAIYENGEVVFAQRTGNGLSYRRIMLDPSRMTELRARIRATLRTGDLRSVYEADGTARAGETRLFLRDAQRSIAVSLRQRSTAATVASPAVPAALRGLRDWLRDFDAVGAPVWQPKYIEVMLWPNPEAVDESIAWPPAWPSLRSPRAMARGQMVSIYLDGSALPALRDFLATQRPKGAVLIGGRKMAVDFRYVFPSEPTWRRAFAALPTHPKAAGSVLE